MKGSLMLYPMVRVAGILVGMSSIVTSNSPSIGHGQELFDWFLSHEGSFFDSARQAVMTTSTTDSDDETQHPLYAVATQDIEKGAVLAIIPESIFLTARERENDNKNDDWSASQFDCATMYTVWRELSRGATSDFAPYLRHLQYQSYKLPSQYSQFGQELFWDILTGENNIMLMDHPIHYEVWDFADVCDGAENAKDPNDFRVGANAAMWVQQFAYPNLHQPDPLIPLADLYPHRNGYFTNVEIQVVDNLGYARVVALRDIIKGERFHASLTECPRCQANLVDQDETGYGTPEIFRDYGFIEDYPQLWAIPEAHHSLSFEDDDGVEQHLTLNGMEMVFLLVQDPVDGRIQLEWELDTIPAEVLPFWEFILRTRIQRLHRLKNIEFPLTAQDYNIPQDEWDAIWKFHHAYSMAMKLAVVALRDYITTQDSSSHLQGKLNGRTAENWEDHYTDFHVELDHIAYNEADCKSSEHTDFFTYQQYELERSNYQEMLWQYRAKDDDTCLHLDGMLQICTSYRPHYHEFFVHYPARYLPEVKRVIFLGSGDAMLLHEILKYPSLEKVVGLELDQTVTRKSFKHFKTQPHYDDPRVEWWYGDATKTLPLLPRDYWGSFDLLLVDLSETVVSLHVTGKHDVLDVISMLLKPEGVMLENELYIDKMTRHFDHSAHIFYGSPKVCVQVHTVSSNSVDFLHGTIYDHGVDMFLIEKIQEPEHRFKFIHDYVKRDPIEEGKCHIGAIDGLATVIEHGRKAGVLMVLEAENCTTPLDENLPILIYDTLRRQGLTPLPGPDAQQKGTIQVVMKEGYIVARFWPSLNYVGFDIHFWGAFDKMSLVRDALSSALGAQTVSSYRLVAGGMHGSSTWEQDQNEIGVQFSQKRNCTVSDRTGLDLDHDATISAALDESLMLLQHQGALTTIVVCGSPEDCLALEHLNRHIQVDDVIPIFPCQGVPDFNDGTEDFQSMYDCERKIVDHLSRLHTNEGMKIDAFVLDLSAPLSMLQIFSSIWEDVDHHAWLNQHYVLAMPFMSAGIKRRRFMDLYRTLLHSRVTTMAEFRFEGRTEQPFLGWRVFTIDDQNAVFSLSQMEARLQDRLPNTKIQVQLLEGGKMHRFDDLLLEERSFRPEDYDSGPNELQMKEQRPLGRQTVFQFEKRPTSTMLTVEELREALSNSLNAMHYHTPRIPDQWSSMGDGAILMSVFSLGNVALIWDGSEHLDINLFVLNEDRELADRFLKHFLEAVSNRLMPTLRDDQPRGIGRVVNFQSDIDRDNSSAIQR